MKDEIPITPFEAIKRMKELPKILEWSRRKHLTVNGPNFWGIHHVYIDNFLKHVVFCLKEDLTTHIFIGNPVRAEEWRKYNSDFKQVLSKKLENEVLEWKIYKDIILYKGKMLPPKETPEEPYWGEVVKVEGFFETINDVWVIGKIKELYKKSEADYLEKQQYSTIKDFEAAIKKQEDQLFGVLLYKRGTDILYSRDPSVIKTTKSHFSNIVNRAQKTIINAKLLLEEAKRNPGKMKELKKFSFPPIEGHPFLDEMTKRIKILLDSYEELFPDRPREQNLNDEELLKLMELSANKWEL